jgi:hypothetical protein
MPLDKSAKKYYRIFFLKDKAYRETETVLRRIQNRKRPHFQELPRYVIYNLWNSLKDNEMQ